MKPILPGIALATLLALGTHPAQAAVKVGFMLPYSGLYAKPGQAIENGFKLYVKERGGKLAGQAVEYFQIDDQSDPSKALDNATRIIKRHQVDLLVGSVHSGVTLALTKAARDSDTTLIIPNGGANAITGPLCSNLVFRTSSSNWQDAYPMGAVAAEQGYKTAVTMTWNYAAGTETANSFKQSFEKNGGKVLKQIYLPFPSTEFAPLLADALALKPDVVFAFFAGQGAIKFVKDYAASNIGKTVPLIGTGFLTEGTLEAQGAAAQGLLTTLHYADGLNTAVDNAFRKSYTQNYPAMVPDVYAVQGYDAAQLFEIGLKAVNGNAARKVAMRRAMSGATIHSPRGTFTLSSAGNPIQDIYLRKVQGDQNLVQGVVMKALADRAHGCRL